jgi:lactate dehydrogenase-like 2-hydroxyacid dehydrogenase
MKIVFLDTKTMGEVPNLDIINLLGSVTYYSTTLPSETAERLSNADIAITCKVVIDKSVIDKIPSLKLICVAATGINNIDWQYAGTKGIVVKNVADYSTNSVAQATFSLVLALLNHIEHFDNYVKTDAYSSNDMFTYMGRTVRELYKKEFGIIGLGAIGKRVAHIAVAFGCNVSYFSTSGKNNSTEYKKVELEYLLSNSDVLSIHAPLNDATRNLINYERIRLMKPAAIIINTSRGGIIDEAGLAKALDENLIAGAGIDVYSKEPIDPDNPLLHIQDKEKVIFSPHSAWTSIEARTLLIEKIAGNIKEFLMTSESGPKRL